MLLSSSPDESLSRAAGDGRGFPQSGGSRDRGKWGGREEAGREGEEGIHLVDFKQIFATCHQSQLKSKRCLCEVDHNLSISFNCQ